MATVNAQAIPAAGIAPTLSAASGGGDAVQCGTNLVLEVYSAGTACTLTITTPGTNLAGDAVADPAFVIPLNSGNVANGAAFNIPLDPVRFADPVTGLATLSWSAVTSIKFAVVAR